MSFSPLRLTWAENEVPHALLDILRGCNITCRACYNTAPLRFRTLEEIGADLDTLLQMRKLDSVSLLGGEVTMHPQLYDIIRMVRKRGLQVELFTNGVLLDEPGARELANAGANVIFLHIEPGQKRPDLKDNSSHGELKRLIREKAAILASEGISAALSLTAYRDDLKGLADLLRFAIHSPSLEYVLVTLYRDLKALGPIRGNLRSGLTGKVANVMPASQETVLTLDEIRGLMDERFGMRPFAVVPSNRSDHEARWLSYLIGSITLAGEGGAFFGIENSAFEPIYIRLHTLAMGRYPFSQRNRPLRARLHLLLNALAGGSIRKNFRLLWAGASGSGTLKSMRIVFQCPAEIGPDGRVVHCRDCPDAVVGNGGLVPVCLCDQVVQ